MFLKSLKTKIYPVSSSPGILNGRAKVQKPVKDCVSPLGPILWAIGTPTYKLSKFFCTSINISKFKWIYNQRFVFVSGRAFKL